MGFLPVGMAAVAAWLLSSHSTLWMWVCIVIAVGCFWSYGIMHNAATNHAAQFRADYRGGFNDLTEADIDAVPDGIARTNMIFSLTAFVALIGAAYTSWT